MSCEAFYACYPIILMVRFRFSHVSATETRKEDYPDENRSNELQTKCMPALDCVVTRKLYSALLGDDRDYLPSIVSV